MSKNMSDEIDEMSYSRTRNFEGNQIMYYMINNFNKDKIIVDGTAGTGSDSIRFSKYFNTVISIEKNPKIFNKYIKKLKNSYNTDIVDIIMNKKLKYDIIYLDPPWTGINYYKTDCLKLDLSGIPLKTIVEKLVSQEKRVVLKLPFNIGGLPKPSAIYPIYSKKGFSFFIFIY